PGVSRAHDARGHRERHAPSLPADAPVADGLPPGAQGPGRPGRRVRVRPVVLRLQALAGARALPAPDHHGRRPAQEIDVKPPGAVEVGRRVFIRPPTARDRDAFLALRLSRRLPPRPWVNPPARRPAFAAYLRRSRRPTERAFLVCRRGDGTLVGVINVSQIFLGAFHSAYLGYYAGASHTGKGYMSEGL